MKKNIIGNSLRLIYNHKYGQSILFIYTDSLRGYFFYDYGYECKEVNFKGSK